MRKAPALGVEGEGGLLTECYMADREMVRSGGRTGEVVLFIWQILGLLVVCGVSAADRHTIGTDGRRERIRQGAWITKV